MSSKCSPVVAGQVPRVVEHRAGGSLPGADEEHQGRQGGPVAGEVVRAQGGERGERHTQCGEDPVRRQRGGAVVDQRGLAAPDHDLAAAAVRGGDALDGAGDPRVQHGGVLEGHGP